MGLLILDPKCHGALRRILQSCLTSGFVEFPVSQHKEATAPFLPCSSTLKIDPTGFGPTEGGKVATVFTS